MKKIYSTLILALILLNANAQDEKKSFLDKVLFKSKDLSLDFKFIDPAKGSFGIDYKLNLEQKICSLSKDNFINKNLNLNLNSKGFVTVAGDRNPTNSIISELKFEGFPLFYIKPHKITSPRRSWIDAEKDPNLEQEAAQLAKQVSSPFWLFLNIHGKHETSQDFKNYDFAFGSSLSITSSFLNAILDAPFNLLRIEPNNSPRQLDLSIGYDYVVGINKTNYAALNDSINNTNRLNLKAEWETGVFSQRDRIIFLLDSYYDMNATQKMKDNKKDWNYFYMIKLDHILHYDKNTKTLTKASIKYTRGALPPNFTQGYVIGGGFSIEF